MLFPFSLINFLQFPIFLRGTLSTPRMVVSAFFMIQENDVPTFFRNFARMTDLHDITYGFSETPFGPIITARNVKGYTDVQFLTYNRAETIHELGTRWGVYTPTVQDDRVAEIVKEVFFDGAHHLIIFDLEGTDFQKAVWREVRMIPFGETATYQEIAQRIGRPDAVRAVANAVAANPLALLIPCHRVVRTDGSIGDYHWGKDLKRQLLEWEKREAPNRQ